MHADARRLAEGLAADLRAIVANRLRTLVVFGGHASTDAAVPETPVHTLALVEALAFPDLDACARLTGAWRRRGLATPLLIGTEEFARSLDAFPVEFGAIIARHEAVTGPDPFEGLAVRTDDLRRACEVQVRSHLLHLREGYLETGGDPVAISRLVADSAAPLAALLTTLARLDGVTATTTTGLGSYAERATGNAGGVLRDVLSLLAARVPTTDAARSYASYVAAIERLVAYVDRWGAAS